MWKVYLLEHQIIVQPLCWFCLSPVPFGFISKLLVLLFVKPLHHLSIYQGDLFTHLKIVCIKNQNIRKNKSKDLSVVIMTNLLVRTLEKYKLQRESSQRDLKICSNYRNFRITEESSFKGFLKEISR